MDELKWATEQKSVALAKSSLVESMKNGGVPSSAAATVW